MSRAVLDTSVVLAVVLGEKGHEAAARVARGAHISSVNLAEIVTKSIELTVPEHIALEYIKGSRITVIDFDRDLAVLAGQLQGKAPRGVLSLGDRACIATAIRMGGTAVTADRIWSTLDLGCPVELIR